MADGYCLVSLFSPDGCFHSCRLLWLGWSPPAITGCSWTWSWWTSTTGGIRAASGCSVERRRAACQVRALFRGSGHCFSKTGRPLVDPEQTPMPLHRTQAPPDLSPHHTPPHPIPPQPFPLLASILFVISFLLCSGLSSALSSAHTSLCPASSGGSLVSFLTSLSEQAKEAHITVGMARGLRAKQVNCPQEIACTSTQIPPTLEPTGCARKCPSGN